MTKEQHQLKSNIDETRTNAESKVRESGIPTQSVTKGDGVFDAHLVTVEIAPLHTTISVDGHERYHIDHVTGRLIGQD